MQRDGISEMDVLKKMNLQMGEDEKMKRCDYIIRNDETEMVIPQVLKLHELLLSLT
jgi:dephospho-CoA kinase